jgi:hypothetical protein
MDYKQRCGRFERRGIEHEISIELWRKLKEQVASLESAVSRLTQERDALHKLSELIVSMHWKVFPNYEYVDPQTSIDLASAEILTCRCERDTEQQSNAALRAELAAKEKRIGEMERELVGLRGLQIVHTYRGDGAEETSTWACTGCIEKDAELSRLRGALEKYADVSNWQSAGTYHGKESGVYLWNGWLHGIEDKPWEIAIEALKGTPCE